MHSACEQQRQYCNSNHLPATAPGLQLNEFQHSLLPSAPSQVGELASHMHSACEQQYLATMGLLLDMQRAVNPVVRAFWR